MDHLSIEVEQQHQPKKEQLEWRRARVLELSSQGRTEREIATILKVGLGTVARDISFLHKQAQENLKYHIQERLPAQYLKCQNGLDQVLKMAWNIIIIDSINQQTKLQALSLISDCYKYQMDLSTNGAIVTDAIKHITQLQNNVNIINKCDKSLEASEAEEDITTNGVF
jgi:hypothetical protein